MEDVQIRRTRRFGVRRSHRMARAGGEAGQSRRFELMNLQDIDAAIEKQRARIQRIKDEMAEADATQDWQKLASRRVDLDGAQRVLVRLAQERRSQTPADERAGIAPNSFFVGGRS